MRMKALLLLIIISMMLSVGAAISQDQAILVPKTTRWTAYEMDDKADLFGKSWRFYREGFTNQAADSLKKLIKQTGFQMKPQHYYIVVADFTESETAIGMFHGDESFSDTRLYRLSSDSLYYM